MAFEHLIACCVCVLWFGIFFNKKGSEILEKTMCSVRNAFRFSLIIVFNLDAFVLTSGLCCVMFYNWRLAEQF